VERPACGIRPDPGPAARGLQQGGRGALEGQSRKRFDHAQSINVRPRPLYAVVILALALGIVATPLVLLAHLFFF
jgi:hypothetical protein